MSFEREVFPSLVGNGLLGWPAAGYWVDIGTPERYLEATYDLLSGHPPSALAPRDETGSLIGEDCLTAGAHIGPQSVLGAHCSVGSDSAVERSVLHDGVVVGADCVIRESVLAERVQVGEGARVEPGALVGASARVAAGARRGGRGAGRAGGERRVTNLNAGTIESLDGSGMLADVVAQPLQLEDALWRAESAGLPSAEAPGGLLVCGMGGSAIGADLADAVLDDRATRPLHVLRGYSPPGWLTSDYFVLCSSYSGETEETLGLLRGRPHRRLAARRADHRRPAGRDGARGRRAGHRHPRGHAAARGRGLHGRGRAGRGCGVQRGAVAARRDRGRPSSSCARLADEWGPGSEGSLAAEVARQAARDRAGDPRRGPDLRPGPPLEDPDQRERRDRRVLLGAARGQPQRGRGLGPRQRELAPLSAVFLESADQHPRVRRRVELTAELAQDAGAHLLAWWTRRATPRSSA